MAIVLDLTIRRLSILRQKFPCKRFFVVICEKKSTFFCHFAQIKGSTHFSLFFPKRNKFYLCDDFSSPFSPLPQKPTLPRNKENHPKWGGFKVFSR